MRFVVDMNLSPKWADRLRQDGYDAIHWSVLGEGDAPDDDIAVWAVAERRIILTADRDFSAIVATSKASKPSVVQLRSSNLRVSAVGDAVLSVIAEAADELEAGALLTFDGLRVRIRPLPIERS